MVILFAASSARLVLLFLAVHSHGGTKEFLYFNDTVRYWQEALALLSGDFSPSVLYDVPLYPLFLRAFFGWLGPHRLLPSLLNLPLFAFSAFLVRRLATRISGPRSALSATALYAFYPTLLVYSILPFSECLYLSLFLSSYLLYLRCLDSPTQAGLLPSAALLGLASLTKEVAVLLPLAYFPLLAFRPAPRHAAKIVTLFLAVYLTVLSPLFLLRAYEGRGWSLSEKAADCAGIIQRHLKISPLRYTADYGRRHFNFYFGTGLVTAMKLWGADAPPLKRANANPLRTFDTLKRTAPEWAAYQISAHLYTAVTYFLAVFSLAMFFRKRRFRTIAELCLPVVYFIVIYFFLTIADTNARYSMPALPFLCILAGSASMHGSFGRRS